MSLTLYAKSKDEPLVSAILAASSLCNVTVKVESSSSLISLALDEASTNGTGDGQTLPILAASFHKGKTHLVSGSVSILRYLAEAYPAANLSGVTLYEKALVDQWLTLCTTSLLRPLTYLKSIGDEAKSPKNKQALYARSDIALCLLALNKHLLSSQFIGGNRCSVADVAIIFSLSAIGQVVPLHLCRKEESHVRNLARWTAGCLELVKSVMSDSEFALISKSIGTLQVKATSTVTQKSGLKGGWVIPKDTPSRALRMNLRSVFHKGESIIGQDVKLHGWAKSIRAQQKFAFLELFDGSTAQILQVVLDAVTTEGFEDATKNSGGTHAAFLCHGKIIKSPAKGQLIEMQCTKVETLGKVHDVANYPFAGKSFSKPESLREICHLRPRTQFTGAVMRIRNACAFATHTFFQQRNFTYVHTPIITTSDCEGAGEMFAVTTLFPGEEEEHNPKEMKDAKEEIVPTVNHKGKKDVDYSKDFFGKPAFLTVSGQLNVEGFCCGMGDVYTFGPTFRAEDSNTRRHLAEFWMIEPEICFADLEDDIALACDYVKFIISFVLANCREDLKVLEKREIFMRQRERQEVEKAKKKGEKEYQLALKNVSALYESSYFQSNPLIARLEKMINTPFKTITYTDAIALLQEKYAKGEIKLDEKPEWGEDMSTKMERALAEELFGTVTVVTDYPKDFKAFYMRLNDDNKTVAAMDILAPGIGELIGGSQREERLDVLERRITEMGLKPEDFEWYVALRKYGTQKHAGFGLGFERVVLLCTGCDNIRDVIPYPRWPGNAAF